MDIRTLRYFVEVIRQQSFTRAAAKLYVTQPTISKMLKHLEEELDCRLIVREGRTLKMTDSGRAVYQRGLTILNKFGQLQAELEDINALRKGAAAAGYTPYGGDTNGGAYRRFPPALPGYRAGDSGIWRRHHETGGAGRRFVSGADRADCRGRPRAGRAAAI
ncbi:putative lysR-family transcriptional regulator [Sodalis glossinidius str. 'morsitans']|uniref:LysR-family transcriptional regulator n=1 Tax=Sodalis glossinidius (strain morsitans) TaxID=343509 RepID=Q2NR26_SODGM|nr:putative lysR-family transcriptional regulator [Sodalis glossinidius str. 'morsitans']